MALSSKRFAWIVYLFKSIPESVTYYTLSEIDSTKVYLEKLKIIYLEKFSSYLLFIVHIPVGTPGNLEAATSFTYNPCLKILKELLYPAEHNVYIYGWPSPVKSLTLISEIADRFSS